MSDAKKHPVLCDCGHERDNGVHCGHDGEAECTVAGCGCEEFHARPVLTAREAVERLREALVALLAGTCDHHVDPFGPCNSCFVMACELARAALTASADLAPEPVTDEDVTRAQEQYESDCEYGITNRDMRLVLEADRVRVAKRSKNRG